MTARTAIFAFFTAAALLAVFHLGLPSVGTAASPRIMSTHKDRASAAGSLTSQLSLRLAHVSSTPPTVRVTMQNTSPSQTLTVLNWDTPFDPVALALGVFKIADASSGQEIPPLGLKVNRKLPPERDALIELAPGATVDKEVTIDKETMPVEPGKEYSVQAKGTFKSVWPMKAGEVGDSQLESLGGGESTGAFQSDSVTLKVE